MKKIHLSRQAICVMLVLLALFAVLTVIVKTNDVLAFDQAVSQFVHSLRSDWLTPIVKTITFSGNWEPIVVICGLFLLLPATRKSYGLPLACGAATQVTFYQVIKNILQRPRPDAVNWLIEEHGFGFPSGHTMIGVVFFGLLALILWKEGKPKWISVLLLVWGVLVGLSRIYVGVHHPTDVLAGWCMGGIILVFWSQVFGLCPFQKKCGKDL